MAAPQPRTLADQLRAEGDQLYRLADLAETPQRDHGAACERIRDGIEIVANDVRSLARGRGFHR